MKVLLIQSHLGRVESSPPLFPLALCYIATALARHEVKIFDLNMWELPLAQKMLEKQIAEFDPDIAGVTIRNIDTTQKGDIFYYFKTIRPTARLIKKAKPGCKLLVGGPGFSMFAKKIMERIPEFDFGIYLEGEDSVAELLNRLDMPESVKGIYIRRKEEVFFTGFREFPDFSDSPISRRDKELIDIQMYMGTDGSNMGIQSKRGCVLQCAYCSYPFLTGEKLRLRSPQSVADEIEYLVSLKVKKFSFVDNVFNIPREHATQICKEIIKRNLDVEWSAWYEMKNTTDELVVLAKNAGCNHFAFSPDAASNKGLSMLKKAIVEDDINENLKIVRRNKVRAGYNFFLLPDMSFKDIFKLFILFFKIPIMLRGRGRVFGLGWIRVEPHTEVHRMAIEAGILKEDTDLLPTDEKELEGLFFCRSSFGIFNFIIIYAFKFLEQYLKPFVKLLRENTSKSRR
jgi:radical SAM superfamily enzyme YgiQ (UPF0313 family)